MVSVIVPCYKVEQYLPRCIESLLNQRYRDLEIILIDDGSPDKCPVICDSYAASDSRVKVIHQQNRGVAAARNAGLDAATGEFISFADGDDYIEPEMIDLLVSSIRDADMSVCGYVTESARAAVCRKNNTVRTINRSDALKEVVVSEQFQGYLWNKLFLKSVIDKYGLRFDERLRMWVDNPFVVSYLAHAENGIRVNSAQLYHYVMRNDSILHTKDVNTAGDMLIACDLMRLTYDNFPDAADYFSQIAFSAYSGIALACKTAGKSESGKYQHSREQMRRYFRALSLPDMPMKLKLKSAVLNYLFFAVVIRNKIIGVPNGK